jgi:hypothetical protein
MTSVWLVDSGDYSSYSVDAIFSTEEQAKEFAEHSGGDYHEWPLNTWTVEQAKFTVMFDLAGNIVEVYEEPYTDDLMEEQLSASSGHSGRIVVRTQRGPRERAIKIASEKFIQIRAKMDEALTRLERAGCDDPTYQRQLQIEVAAILAGIEAAPAGDSRFERMVLSALAETGGAQ